MFVVAVVAAAVVVVVVVVVDIAANPNCCLKTKFKLLSNKNKHTNHPSLTLTK